MMKSRFLTTLTILGLAFFAVQTCGQDNDAATRGLDQEEAVAADSIGVLGPTEAKLGDEVTLSFSGVPSIDLSEPLLNQLNWLLGDDRMFVYLQTPGKAMAPLDVEATIVFSTDGATLRPQVAFVAAEEGEHRVIVDWNYDQNQIAEHVVTVVGEQEPDPPEPTPGSLSVLLSYEAGDQTAVDPAQADILTNPSLRKYLDEHCVVEDGQPAWRFLDLSEDTGSNMPEAWQAVIARARGKATPWLIIDNGNATYEGPCPTSVADLLAKLQQYGGK